VLHSRLSVVGHARPPLAAAVTMLGMRVCCPVPHGREHSDQLPHVKSQCTGGHGCVLHSRISGVGHARPPLAACAVTMGTRVCLPVPHG
jgi:hypothetical protein